MSVAATSWAWRWIASGVFSHGEAVILLRLADHADATGLAFPGNEHVAEMTGSSTRSVERLKVKLVEMELAEIEKKALDRGRGRAFDCVILAMDRRPDQPDNGDNDQPDNGDGPTRQPGPDQPDNGDGALYKEPSKEPSKEPDPDSEEGLFGYWKTALGKTDATSLTPKRRAKLRARLKEKPTRGPTRADDIRAAIDFVAGSSWHRDRGHVDLTLICRSPEQIDSYLERSSAKTAAGEGDLSIYDQAVQR